MFTTKERQKQRTGRYGSSRDDYLQELVTEFQKTTNEDSKLSIVAHLANFAYDPFNYEYFRKLQIIDLFLDCLTEPCAKMVEYGIAGICNCCPDPANAAILAKNDGIPFIIACLASPIGKTVLNAVTALYYLCSPLTKTEILVPSVVEQMQNFASSTTMDIQLRNTAKAFLDKHVTT
eukprot:c20669_g1_i1 orf=504-1034(-)